MSSASCRARCIRWLGEAERPPRADQTSDLTIEPYPLGFTAGVAAALYGLTTDESSGRLVGLGRGHRNDWRVGQVAKAQRHLRQADYRGVDPQHAAEADPDIGWIDVAATHPLGRPAH